jgi:hypothetical protein
MLEMLDKFSVYIAIGILGYLTYTTFEKTGLNIDVDKELPVITKKMLKPELIEPKNHASPAERDPFEVDWATYFDISEMTGIINSTDETIIEQRNVKPFEKRLMAILTAGDGGGAALIEGKVYEVGSLIDGTDPKTCWKVDEIKKDEVIVTLGQISNTLKISQDTVQEEYEEDYEQEYQKEDIEYETEEPLETQLQEVTEQ